LEYDNGPIVIENGVWLCAGSTVLRGVTVGANSVVGAMSLVSADIPPNSIVRPPPPIVMPG
jgi:putative colanic acid biosynthesis acetyltransferase WcaF